jgi:hypothetical protein
MKHILIAYTFVQGSEENWQQEVKRFVTALETDADLNDKISYTALKNGKGSDYYHLAIVQDDEAAKLLNQKDFFKHYTEQNELISQGTLTVTPLELIAATK